MFRFFLETEHFEFLKLVEVMVFFFEEVLLI